MAKKRIVPQIGGILEDIRIELISSRRVADIVADMVTKHGVTEAQVLKDIETVETEWAGLGRATMEDRRFRNIETARRILEDAMKGGNTRSKIDALSLVAKLEGSFPSENSNSAMKGLLDLARAAAVGAGTVAGQQAAGPFEGMTPRNRDDRPEPMGSRAPRIPEVSESSVSPEVAKQLANGRADLSGVTEEREKSGALRLHVQPRR